MNVSMSKMGRALGVAALGLGLIGTAGCDAAEKAADACNLSCPAEGIADGNASISGVLAIDGFFGSVVNFDKTASSVSAGIEAELDGIRSDFGIAADADLKAALEAQFAANLQGGIRVKAEPARCAVDAQASLEAQASCQASAECDVQVDPGSAKVECSGGCEVDASVMATCSAEADLKCTVTAPSVACSGECKGTCEVMAMAMAGCEGTCEGTCQGTCSATNAMGQCAGKCEGMCTGKCTAELDVGATCSGTCKGECTVTNPEGGCMGGVRASCEAKADAKVECEGRCDGEITPPSAMAECEASASCEASAKADASINVQCTPPSVQIDYELKANADLMAQARFEAGLRNLKTRLPSLLASLKKASLVVEAGAGLVASAEGAVKGAASAVADGDVDFVAAYKLGKCVPGQLAAVAGVIEGGTTKLSAQASAAASVTAAVGL